MSDTTKDTLPTGSVTEEEIERMRTGRDRPNYSGCDYYENSNTEPQNLGLAGLTNPFPANVASQRGLMYNSHMNQSQIPHGAEPPKVFTGYEPIVGKYEYDSTEREDGVIQAIIPKFIINTGIYQLKENPSNYIIIRRDDGKIDYFTLEQYTHRTDGYGYKNKWLNTNYVTVGNWLSKHIKLSTSPAHIGPDYCLGVNLNTVYMDHPLITEDAIVISQSAAAKFHTTGIAKMDIQISPNQVPINLYGDDEEYKFFPDVGERVRDDGVLLALRTPSADSIIQDMSPSALKQMQQFDERYYVPIGAKVIDVDVHINRKSKTKPKDMWGQVQKYRDQINNQAIRIWEAYQEAVKNNQEITPQFNTLVTRAMTTLMADNVRIPGFNKKADVTLVKKKEVIEFIYLSIKYVYENAPNAGYKIAGNFGNKGVCCTILPDDEMPHTLDGTRADIIIGPVSVYNRMNTGQLMVHAINFMSMKVLLNIRKGLETQTITYDIAYGMIIEFLNDINYKWGELVDKIHNVHPEKKKELVEDALANGMRVQVNPFMKGFDTQYFDKLFKKYEIEKSYVSYVVKDEDGTPIKKVSKQKMMVSELYWFILYKIPHMRAVGVSHVNQYCTPVRPSNLAKNQYPFSQTPIRLGEDEIRNLVMTSGSEVASHILGVYANSRKGVDMMTKHLLFAEEPAKLDRLPITKEEVTDTNSVMQIARHMFASFGVDLRPDPETVQRITEMVAVDKTGTEQEDVEDKDDD